MEGAETPGKSLPASERAAACAPAGIRSSAPRIGFLCACTSQNSLSSPFFVFPRAAAHSCVLCEEHARNKLLRRPSSPSSATRAASSWHKLALKGDDPSTDSTQVVHCSRRSPGAAGSGSLCEDLVSSGAVGRAACKAARRVNAAHQSAFAAVGLRLRTSDALHRPRFSRQVLHHPSC